MPTQPRAVAENHGCATRSKGNNVSEHLIMRSRSDPSRVKLSRPIGREFLAIPRTQAGECTRYSLVYLEDAGKKAPRCYEHMGTALSLLDAFSSCFWGCAGGDHKVEYLLLRSANSGHAALMLALSGHYDESLSITRNLAEIANLLALFVFEPSTLTEWKGIEEQRRKQRFSPLRVRLRLEDVCGTAPISKERYGALCEVGTHANPSTIPQAHNLLGIPTASGRFQEAGLLMSLNELARAISLVTFFGPRLLGVPKELQARSSKLAKKLEAQIGGVGILTRHEEPMRLSDQDIKRIYTEVKAKLVDDISTQRAIAGVLYKMEPRKRKKGL